MCWDWEASGWGVWAVAAGENIDKPANNAGMLAQDKTCFKLKIYSYLNDRGILSEIPRS